VACSALESRVAFGIPFGATVSPKGDGVASSGAAARGASSIGTLLAPYIVRQCEPRNRRHLSIPLDYFEPLSRVPGVQLLSIQKNAGFEQLTALKGRFPVTDLGTKLDESTGPFLDTAAVLKSLDLFITSDTAVAHLAGALGVPVWMPLSTTPDWRWMTDREDNPWYPKMRIFRQQEHMAWGPDFQRMAAELRALVPSRVRTPSMTVSIAPGELIDKITILEIKNERITDAEKLRHVRAELAMLTDARDRWIFESEELAGLIAELKSINEQLWDT
jgi:hypothetical protein